MHPGSGSPFDVCKPFEGNDGVVQSCETLVQSCVDQRQEQEGAGADPDASSSYTLAACNGKALPNPVTTGRFETCLRLAVRIAGKSDLCGTPGAAEAKPAAKPAEGDKVALETVNGKARPSKLPENAVLVVGSRDDAAAKGARYLIDRSGPDVVSTIEQWLGVTRQEAMKLRRETTAVFFRRGAQGAFERLGAGATEKKAEATGIDGAQAPADLPDGAVVVIGALELPETMALLKGVPGGKPYFIDAGGQDVVSTIEAWLGVSRAEAVRMRRRVGVYLREKGAFRATSIDELTAMAADKPEPAVKPEPKPEPKPETKVEPTPEPKPATGPKGFVESSPDTIDAILREIGTAPYPVLVVVGQVAKDVGDRECPHCVEFKKDLEAAQEGGRMAYHRLVFVNLNRSSARSHLERLGIMDAVMAYGYVPQTYVFKGGELVSPGEEVGAFTKKIQEMIMASEVPGAQQPEPPTEKKPEAPEETPEQREHRETKELLRQKKAELAAAKKAEEDRIAAEKEAAKKAEEDRIAAEKEAARRAEEDRIAAEKAAVEKAAAEKKAKIDARRIGPVPTVPLKPQILHLTAETIALEWKSPMAIVVTNAIDDDEFRRYANDIPVPMTETPEGSRWGRIGIIDWSDPKGRALARTLGLSALEPFARDRLWTFSGDYRQGAFQGRVSNDGGNDVSVAALIERSSMTPDANGFLYVDELVFGEHFGPDAPEAIVVVGDPTTDEAATVMAQLASERAELGEPWRLFWIPHTKRISGAGLAAKLGIVETVTKGGKKVEVPKLPKDGRIDIWRVNFNAGAWGAGQHEPAGFLQVVSVTEANRYLNDDARTILVVGASDGEAGKASAELRRFLVEAQSLPARSPNRLEVDNRAIERLVYVDIADFDRIYGPDSEAHKLVERNEMFPQAFLVSGKPGKKGRTWKPLDVKELPGQIEPVERELVIEASPSAAAGASGGMLPLKGPKEKAFTFKVSNAREKVGRIDLSDQAAAGVFAKIRQSPVVIVWGDEAKHPSIGALLEKLGNAVFFGSEEAGAMFLDTGKGDELMLLTMFRMKDGKPLGDHGIAKCERSSNTSPWTCYPYEIPENK